MTVTYQPLLAREMEMELRSRLHFDSLMTASQLVPGLMTTNSRMPNLPTHSITADIHQLTTLEETSASFCMLSDPLVTMKTITNQWDIILLFHSEEK